MLEALLAITIFPQSRTTTFSSSESDKISIMSLPNGFLGLLNLFRGNLIVASSSRSRLIVVSCWIVGSFLIAGPFSIVEAVEEFAFNEYQLVRYDWEKGAYLEALNESFNS